MKEQTRECKHESMSVLGVRGVQVVVSGRADRLQRCTGLLWFAPHLLGCAPGSQGRDGEGGSSHTLFVLSCNSLGGWGWGRHGLVYIVLSLDH